MAAQAPKDLAALETGFETILATLDTGDLPLVIGQESIGRNYSPSINFVDIPAGNGYLFSARRNCVTQELAGQESTSCEPWYFELNDSRAHQVRRVVRGTIDISRGKIDTEQDISVKFPFTGDPIFMGAKVSPFFLGDYVFPSFSGNPISIPYSLNSLLNTPKD